jgi:O-Antigen ligase
MRRSKNARESLSNPFVRVWLLILLTLAFSMTQFIGAPASETEHNVAFHLKSLLYSATLIWLMATTIRREQDLIWLFCPMILSLALVLIDYVHRFRGTLTLNETSLWVDARLELGMKVAFLILFVPPSFLFFKKISARILIGALGMLGLLLLAALGMRSGWLLAFGTIVIWLAFRPLSAIVMLPALLFCAVTLASFAPNYALERLNNGFHDLSQRPEVAWLPTLKMIQDRPGRGFGFGGHFAQTLRKYERNETSQHEPNQEIRDPHNFYLQMAWYGGAITITAIVAAMAYLIGRLLIEFRSRASTQGGHVRLLVYGLTCSLLLLWCGIIANSETPNLFTFSMAFATASIWHNLVHGGPGYDSTT